MTFHFPDQVDTNVLTIDATDPKSGTAEFKAAAIRVEKLAGAGGGRRVIGRSREEVPWTSICPGAEPTADERAAVDDVLGAADSGWDGAERDERDPPRGARRPRRPRTTATCCCPRCTRCRRASAGSARAA